MNPTPKPKTPDFMDPCKLTLHIAEVLKEFSARAEQQLSNTSDQDMIPVDLKEPFVIFMVTDRLFSVKGCELQFEEVGSQFQKVPTLVVKAITDALLRVAEPQMLSFEELSKEVSESQRDSLRELDNSSSTKKQTRKERMLLDAKVLSRKGLKLLTDAAIRAGHAMVDELFQPRYVPRPGSAGVLRQAAEVAKGLFSKFFSTEASQGFYRTNEDVGDRDTERWWGTRLKVDTVDNMAAEVTGFALHRKTESCTSTLLTHIKGSFASADGLIPALAVPSGHCDLGDNLLALQRRIAKSLDVWLERSKTLLASNIQGGAEQHEMPLVRVNLMQQVAIAVSVAHFAFVWASQATDRQGSVSTFLHENGREQKKAKYVPFKDLAHRVAAAMQPEGALSFDDLSNNVAKLRVRCKTHCNRLDPGDVERTLLDFVFLALQWIEDSSVAAVDAKHERVAELFCPGYEPRQLSRSHLKKAVGVAKQLWVDLTSAHERDTSHWTKDTGNSGALLQKLETLLPETNAIMFLEKQPPPVCVISSLLSRIPSRPGPSPPVPTVAAIPEPRPVTSDTPNVEGRQASMSAAPAPATPAAPAAPAGASGRKRARRTSAASGFEEFVRVSKDQEGHGRPALGPSGGEGAGGLGHAIAPTEVVATGDSHEGHLVDKQSNTERVRSAGQGARAPDPQQQIDDIRDQLQQFQRDKAQLQQRVALLEQWRLNSFLSAQTPAVPPLYASTGSAPSQEALQNTSLPHPPPHRPLPLDGRTHSAFSDRQPAAGHSSHT